MQSISVQLGERSYAIKIGTDIGDKLIESLATSISDVSHWILIADSNVSVSFAEQVQSKMASFGWRSTKIVVPSGERSKSTEELTRLWNELLTLHVDRKSVIVSIGGGVVGDLAGFVASTFNRGLRFVQIPTTLLAMVDSSVGGKTGINLPAAKNIVGAFWQPQLVWIDTMSLNTLPDREFISGLAEVVKYGIILDPKLFEYLEQNAEKIVHRDSACIETIVRRSCELKAEVVAQDERETTGLRAILNYGHTFGHALEAITDYGVYLHGEAVAIGMTMAASLAVRLKKWESVDAERQSVLLKRLGLPTAVDTKWKRSVPFADAMLEAMQRDKKTLHGKLNFILPTRIGHVQSFSDCSRDDVTAVIG